MTTLYTQQRDGLRVPHHPAHCPDTAPLSLWRRILNRILAIFK
jgi:hypothetical protein